MNKEKLIKILSKVKIRYTDDEESADNCDTYSLCLFFEKNGLSFSYGCTKGCIIIPNEKYVIKFNLSSEDEECERELENYREAEYYGIERILAKIEYFYTNPQGIEFYKQERYTTSQESLSHKKHCRYERNTEQIKYQICERIDENAFGPTSLGHYNEGECWLKKAIHVYGRNFMKEFVCWTNECRVNDLHTENVGYIRNRPIVIDYSGYRV